MSPSRHSVYTCNEISALTVVCSVSPRRCTWHGVYKGVIPSKRLVTPAQGRSMSSTWRPRSLYRVKAVRVVTVVSVSWPPDVHATIGRSLDAPKRRLHRWVREIPLYLSVSDEMVCSFHALPVLYPVLHDAHAEALVISPRRDVTGFTCASCREVTVLQCVCVHRPLLLL